MFLHPVASKASLHILGQFDPLQHPIEQGKLVFEDEETGLSYGPQPASWPGRQLLKLRGCAGANIQGTVDGPVRVAGPFTTNLHPNARVRGQMEPVREVFNQETQTHVLDTFSPVFAADDEWVDKSGRGIEHVDKWSAISAVLHRRTAITRPNYGPPVDPAAHFTPEDIIFARVLDSLLLNLDPLDDAKIFEMIWNNRRTPTKAQLEFDIRRNPIVTQDLTAELRTRLRAIINDSCGICFGFDSNIPQLHHLLQY